MLTVTSNVAEVSKWFSAKAKAVPRAVERAVQKPEALAELHVIGVEGMQDFVYSVPESPRYKRTFALLNAVYAAREAGGAILSVNAGATRSREDPSVSYGYFMSTAGYTESFHQYVLPRYYLEYWYEAAALFAERKVRAAVQEELAR